MKHLGSFRQHRDGVTSLAFRKGSNQLFSASQDRCVKVWNVDQMSYMDTLFGHQDAITCLDALTMERCLTSGSRDKTLRLWKIVEESQLVFRTSANTVDVALNEHDPTVKEKGSMGGSADVVALIDEDTFLSGGDNGSISLWNTGKNPI